MSTFPKSTIGRVALLLVAALILFMGYFYYSLAAGQARMRQTCALIHPGMTRMEIAAFADAHGLSLPKHNSAVAHLGEFRSYGRFTCRVTFENDRVKSSEYNFAD